MVIMDNYSINPIRELESLTTTRPATQRSNAECTSAHSAATASPTTPEPNAASSSPWSATGSTAIRSPAVGRGTTAASAFWMTRSRKRKIQRDLQLEDERVQRQAAYVRELQEIQDDIDLQRRMIKCRAEEEEQKNVLAQQRADLVALKETQARLQQKKKQNDETNAGRKSAAATSKPKGTSLENTDEPVQPGTAKADWERLKQLEGARSAPLDTLMSMIGLEDVKREFFSIKLKVDTTLRQGVFLGSERFSCSLLGNPGTGNYGPALNQSLSQGRSPGCQH